MNTEIAEELWASLAALFSDEDDNPIPEMQMHGVPPGAASAVWERLLSGADFAVPDATVFVTTDERDALARETADLAGRAERGEIDMHLVVSNVTADGIRLPDLGVSIYPGLVAIDYRVNVWSRSTVAAFVSLLAELQTLATGSEVTAADEVGRAWDQGTQHRLRSAITRVRSD